MRDLLGRWLGLGTVLIALAALSFEMPTSLSGSGHLTVFFSEPASLALFVALVVAAITHHYRPTVWAKRMLTVLLIFCAWYVIASVARLMFGGNVKQSLLVIRTTLLPLAAYFAVDARWDNRQRIVSSVVLLNCIFVVLHLPDWQDMRMSSYLGNSIVYDTLVVLLVPLNLVVITYRSEAARTIRAVAMFNLLAAFVLPLWTGSRSAVGMIGLAVLSSLLVLRPSKRALLHCGAVALAAVLLHAAVWLFNPQGAAYGLYRLVPTPGQVASATGWGWLQPFDSADREAHADVAAAEMGKSDAGRSELVELAIHEFRSQPFFGTGRVYFELQTDDVQAQYSAHNFVLDHLNAYGLPGFLLYLCFFAVLLAPKIRRWRPGTPGFIDNGISLITTAVVMGVSLTQPTMMIPVVITTYFVVVSGLQTSGPAEIEPAGALTDQ